MSAELNRPFAIRGDLGVVWERQPDERGWRSWIPWPHVHAEDIVLGNPPAIPQVTTDPSAAGGGDPCPAGAAEQNGVPAVDQAGAARRTVDPPCGRQQ
ncbi:AsmA family protein [Klebsiella pneumoniae]